MTNISLISEVREALKGLPAPKRRAILTYLRLPQHARSVAEETQHP